jgi:hypothetical protein
MSTTNEVLSEVVEIARNYLRDFPKFFQTAFDVQTRTFELGHPNIDKDSLYIAIYTSNTPVELAASAFSLDQRNGIVRLNSTPPANSRLMVEGYHYEWVLPSDLEFYAKHAMEAHSHNLNIPLELATPAVIDVVGIAALIEVLWALMTEYSRDIDVMTSESVHIPGSQRFNMVRNLIEGWEQEYRKLAKALNIGPERIEIMNLRRVSRTTNRYVPIYKAKELGDYGPIERIFPDQDNQHIKYQVEEPLREDVFVDVDPPIGITTNAFY